MKKLLCIGLFWAATTFAQSPFANVRAKLESDELREASATIDSCLKNNFQKDSGYYYKTLLLLKMDNLKSAKQYREKLSKEYPEFFNVHYLNALIYFTDKDYGKSIEEFNALLKTDPKNLKALYNRSLAFGLLEDYKTAKEDLSKCIEFYPNYPQAYYSRAYWSELSGDFTEAIKDYEMAISLSPKNYDAYLGLAHTFQLQKDTAKACETLGRAIAAGSQIAEDVKENYCR